MVLFHCPIVSGACSASGEGGAAGGEGRVGEGRLPHRGASRGEEHSDWLKLLSSVVKVIRQFT